MLLNNYMSQHANVRETVAKINNLYMDNLVENAFEIATQISRLAGILKIHLDGEDKYLYPSLEKNDDIKIRSMSITYQKEMGGIHQEFQKFKDKYNTKQKLIDGEKMFSLEWKVIATALEKRMDKEENGIYQHIV